MPASPAPPLDVQLQRAERFGHHFGRAETLEPFSTPPLARSALVQRMKTRAQQKQEQDEEERKRQSRRQEKEEESDSEISPGKDELPDTRKPDPFHGSVQIAESRPEQDDRGFSMASLDKAKKIWGEHPQTLRLDLRNSLVDAQDDSSVHPDDRLNLLVAHAARLGQIPGDVCVNCKSGKTRTPVVAMVYRMLSQAPGEDVDRHIAASMHWVNEGFKRDRPGVALDYAGNLTGVPLTDKHGKLTGTIPPMFRQILKQYGGKERNPREWVKLAAQAEESSNQLRKKSTGLWSAYKTGVEQENQRLAEQGVQVPELWEPSITNTSSKTDHETPVAVDEEPDQPLPTPMETEIAPLPLPLASPVLDPAATLPQALPPQRPRVGAREMASLDPRRIVGKRPSNLPEWLRIQLPIGKRRRKVRQRGSRDIP